MAELQLDEVVVVLRLRDPEDAYVAAAALIDGGVKSVEITMTVPSATELIERLRGSGARIGAGTVLSAATVREVVDAGARFVVAPDTRFEVIEAAQHAGVPAIAGALTPTELSTAIDMGASAVKIFPVDALGGPDYIASLRGPFPDAALVVSGGVTTAGARRYLSLGVRSVCMGREFLQPDEVGRRDARAISARAQRVLAELLREEQAGL